MNTQRHTGRRRSAALSAALMMTGVLGGTVVDKVGAVTQVAPQILVSNATASQAAMSGDGRLVAYVGAPAKAAAGVTESVWLYDISDGRRTELTVTRSGVRPGNSRHPQISADGCTLVVTTEIGFDLLYDNDDLNRWDVYRTVLPGCDGAFDLGEWELVSAGTGASLLAMNTVDSARRVSVSASGAAFAFTYFPLDSQGLPLAWSAVGLVDATIAAGQAGRVRQLPGLPSTPPENAVQYRGQRDPVLSDDGRFVAFTSDAVFTVVDNPDAETLEEQMSVGWGTVSDAQNSAISQVFRLDRDPSDLDDSFPMRMVSTTEGGLPAGGSSSQPDIAGNGRFVSFTSTAHDLQRARTAGEAAPLLAPGAPSQVYRADLEPETPVVELVSRNPQFAAGDAASHSSSIDASGQQIGFLTRASGLVAGTPGAGDASGFDALVANLGNQTMRRANTRPDGSAATAGATRIELSRSARFISIDTTHPTDLLPAGAAVHGGSGIVVQSSTPNVTAASIVMEATQVGRTSVPWYLLVVNGGTSAFIPATITSSDEQFDIVGGSCRPLVPLPPGSSCGVNFTFTPVKGGQSTTTITLAEAGFAGVVVAPKVTGTGGVPTVTASPISLGLGKATVGERGSAPADIRIANLSFASVQIESVTKQGENPDDFSIDLDTCTGRKLSVSQTCTVNVSFAPLGAGPRTAVISVKTVGGGAATTVVSGEGRFEPVITVSAPKVLRGGEITVKGSGLPSMAALTITLERGGSPMEVSADYFGNLTATYVVPKRAPVGRNRILVGDLLKRFEPTASGRFAVTSDDDDDQAYNPSQFGG